VAALFERCRSVNSFGSLQGLAFSFEGTQTSWADWSKVISYFEAGGAVVGSAASFSGSRTS